MRRPGIEPGSRDREARMIPLHQRHYMVLFDILKTILSKKKIITTFLEFEKAN